MISVFYAKPDPSEVRHRFAGWRQIWVWLPVLLAMGVIAMESTDTFSSEHTSGWLRPILQRLFGSISDQSWALLHHVLRKCGHFLGFGLVCLACLRSWLITLGQRISLSMRNWLVEAHGLALGSTALIASLDEWHQTFLPSRTGKVTDVLLDTTGGLVLCAIAAMVRRMVRPWADNSFSG